MSKKQKQAKSVDRHNKTKLNKRWKDIAAPKKQQTHKSAPKVSKAKSKPSSSAVKPKQCYNTNKKKYEPCHLVPAAHKSGKGLYH